MTKTYHRKHVRDLFGMAREKSPLCLSFDPFGSGSDPWIVRYVVDERGFWLQFNDDYGNGSSVLSAREIHGMTGFDPDDLESEELGDVGRIYGLPGKCPLLPVPFTAEQFLEFDRRAGYFFSDYVGQGDATEEWLVELEKSSPEAVDLAREIQSRARAGTQQTTSLINESLAAAVLWKAKKPMRFQGFNRPLYKLLNEACTSGFPIPTVHDVMDSWKSDLPGEIEKVLPDGIDYYISTGKTKTADIRAIQKAISRMIIKAQS